MKARRKHSPPQTAASTRTATRDDRKSLIPMLKFATARHGSGSAESRTPGFGRRFLPVWGVGLLGVAALLLQEPPASLFENAPAMRELPDLVVRLALMVNPLILMTVMAACGAAVAPRVGFGSALAGHAGARLDARTAMVAGFAVAGVLVSVDAVMANRLGPGWQKLSAQADAAPWLSTLVLGVLYGGLAEEVIARWGLMSLVVWAVLRLQRRQAVHDTPPSHAAAWIGIVVAAAIFAVGHLPALAQSVELSPSIVVRTLGLNMLAGMAYGWLFWRRSLESAMLAHATTHMGLALARWLA